MRTYISAPELSASRQTHVSDDCREIQFDATYRADEWSEPRMELVGEHAHRFPDLRGCEILPVPRRPDLRTYRCRWRFSSKESLIRMHEDLSVYRRGADVLMSARATESSPISWPSRIE